ncbi:NupC/NupG family nucleoside CNT transporter [Bacillus sp. S/N-304-OC-R1]|uniref:NupC/NupG family nucleoside CNT transporter n=1 Tax=Bacillus sp. S/N-304-OC-R1 TaxID=2758034 RepID=UPI001C8D6E09|nr:NupC/NupG family nucleoside CNT transporter [Bacillus sp. S/N-304-OC-R1]MBY0123350.1 NupC/NupG family nucleoside CNT transporter [Bacillus sp. S/N-304-OC-R1]
MNILWGLMGCFVILFIAFLLSENKKKINYRVVLGGTVLQILFGYIVLKSETGRIILEKISKGIQSVIHYGNEGLSFVFGSLADASQPTGFIFGIRVACMAIFVTALISVLYHFGIMQLFVRIIGGGLHKLLGTSKVESLTAASNIFLGLQEAPVIIKPYIRALTKSEIFAVMVGGLASVAGGILLAYAALGIPINYLLSASFMAAPAGLVFAKMMIPETEVPVAAANEGAKATEEKEEKPNIIDVIVKGAMEGLKMAGLIIAMLIAFISILALLNGILGSIGEWFGMKDLSLQLILGYIFSPIAFIMGVPWSEAMIAGNLLGQKLILNEMVAFTAFQPLIETLSPKTVAIVTFSLCGFANLGSLGILIASMTAFAENQRQVVTKLALKAVLAGTLANLMSGTIAGMFM